MIVTENKYFIFDMAINNHRYLSFSKYLIKSLWLKLLLHCNAPEYHEKKYKVSICAIFKNEALYFREWIEFHRIVGIDHFYLYNNFSDDSYLSVLDSYIKEGLVTLIDFPVQQGQMLAYKDCIARFKNESEWIGFIDLDEFIVPKSYDSVYEFLGKYKKYPSVQLYWRLFGTNGRICRSEIDKHFITEDFVVCWQKYDSVGKCFFNTAFDFNPDDSHNKFLHHKLWGEFKKKVFPPVNHEGNFLFYDFNNVSNVDFPIQINHYFTKSYDEYIQKTSKGDVYFKDNPHNFDYFYRHEMKCVATDYSAYKYLIKLKIAMGCE